jgi:hypothetical protein
MPLRQITLTVSTFRLLGGARQEIWGALVAINRTSKHTTTETARAATFAEFLFGLSSAGRAAVHVHLLWWRWRWDVRLGWRCGVCFID